MKKYSFVLIILIYCAFTLLGQSTITIDVTKPGITISPKLYGIFFEEINHSGEGGLYAEMVLKKILHRFH